MTGLDVQVTMWGSSGISRSERPVLPRARPMTSQHLISADFRHSLNPYVSDHALSALAQHPQGGWGETEGTLAFFDVSGFTSLTERLARLGRSGAEHFEVLRSTVAMGGLGQAVLPFQFAAIALVADNGVLRAEAIAGLQGRAFKEPVLRPVNLERTGSIHELTVAFVIAAPKKTDTGQLVFGTLHEMVTPQR